MIRSFQEPRHQNTVMHINMETNQFAVSTPDSWKRHSQSWFGIGNGLNAEQFVEHFITWTEITEELNG